MFVYLLTPLKNMHQASAPDFECVYCVYRNHKNMKNNSFVSFSIARCNAGKIRETVSKEGT